MASGIPMTPPFSSNRSRCFSNNTELRELSIASSARGMTFLTASPAAVGATLSNTGSRMATGGSRRFWSIRDPVWAWAVTISSLSPMSERNANVGISGVAAAVCVTMNGSVIIMQTTILRARFSSGCLQIVFAGANYIDSTPLSAYVERGGTARSGHLTETVDGRRLLFEKIERR